MHEHTKHSVIRATPKAGVSPQPNFVVNFVVNFVDKVDDEDAL